MLRHTAFFLFREDITPAQHLAMLKGLAYMRFECRSVVALDYGTDLFGGSEVLRETKPWDRTPRWRAAEAGPPCNYDVALMLDFADQAGLDAYNDDDVHHEVGDYNASICRPEMTARVDWNYDGESADQRPATSATRRCSCGATMWMTRQRTPRSSKRDGSTSADDVETLTVAPNVGPMATDFDWILDVHVPDEKKAKSMLEGDVYGGGDGGGRPRDQVRVDRPHQPRDARDVSMAEGVTGGCIDVHCHVTPQRFQKAVLDGNDWHGMTIADGELDNLPNRWLPDRRIEEMDKIDIDVQVVSPTDVFYQYGQDPKVTQTISREVNEEVAEMARDYPDRIMGLGTLPMQDTKRAIEEATHAIKELGLVGFMIDDHVNALTYDHDVFEEFWTAIEELGAFILIHQFHPTVVYYRIQDYFLLNSVGNLVDRTLAWCGARLRRGDGPLPEPEDLPRARRRIRPLRARPDRHGVGGVARLARQLARTSRAPTSTASTTTRSRSPTATSASCSTCWARRTSCSAPTGPPRCRCTARSSG